MSATNHIHYCQIFNANISQIFRPWFMMLLPLNVYLFNTLHQYWYWPLFGLLETRWHGHPSSGLTPLLCWMSSVQWSLVTWQCVTSTQTGKNCNRITRLALTSFFNYSWATQQQVRSHHILHCISASYIWYLPGKGWQCASVLYPGHGQHCNQY